MRTIAAPRAATWLARTLLGIALGASPALAGTASIALAPDSGPPDAVVEVLGAGFRAAEPIVISFDRVTIATTRSRLDGTFLQQVTIPSAATPGAHQFDVLGRWSSSAGQATFRVRTDWLQYHGGPTRNGVNVHENVIGVRNASRLKVDWSSRVGRAVPGSLAYAGGLLFAGTEDGSACAVEAATGRLRWSSAIGSTVICSPAVIKGFNPQPDPPGKEPRSTSTLLVTSDRDLVALDATTGRQFWRASIGTITQSPLVLDSNEGAIGDANERSVHVLLGTTAGEVHSYGGDGALEWQAKPDRGAISGSICAIGDANDFDASLVYVATASANLHALLALDGSTAWSVALDGVAGTPALGGPDTTDPLLYVGTDKGTLYSIEAATGRIRWRYAAGSAIVDAPVVGDGSALRADALVVVATGKGAIYAISDANEKPGLVWTTNLGATTRASLSLANGVVHGVADDGRLCAFDLANGNALFVSTPLSFGRSSPVIADGSVFLGNELGELVRLVPR